MPKRRSDRWKIGCLPSERHVKVEAAFAVVLVYFKKHLLFKDITNHRCKKMRLVTETPQWIHMDGETPYQVSEVTWESKGKLRFVR